ncbi:hypothetical protein C789_2103 [Microcystis aeruginosa FACHB-905 = DIANCHI905]|nr:hypothetical protein C789_2103 [Microcystis aeruginosa FACHB-905 = DIANCHI905]
MGKWGVATPHTPHPSTPQPLLKAADCLLSPVSCLLSPVS